MLYSSGSATGVRDAAIGVGSVALGPALLPLLEDSALQAAIISLVNIVVGI